MTLRGGYLFRYRRPLVLSVAAAVGLYLVGIVLSDGQAVAGHLAEIGAGTAAFALALPTLGFLIRFLRWDIFLRSLGHRMPPFLHLRIYLAGFALTTTPGKVGENLRALFLRPEGVPVSHSFAAFVAERMGDLLAILLLTGLAGGLLGDYGWLLTVSTGITILGLLLLRYPALPAVIRTRVGGGGLPARILLGAARALDAARDLLTMRLLTGGVAIALLAWGSEALAFGLVARGVGVELSLQTGMGIFAVATLLGAISFLPGGVGPTEAVMGGLLVLAGATLSQAAAATVLIRAVTLWWAVALGVVAVLGLSDPSARSTLMAGDPSS